MEIFANRLKEARKEKGLTQKELATILQIRQQSYARYEANTAEPSYDMLVEIADFFELSADYLLGRADF